MKFSDLPEHIQKLNPQMAEVGKHTFMPNDIPIHIQTMPEHHLFLPGRVPSKKNSKRIVFNRKTHKPFIISSKDYIAWEREMSGNIDSQWNGRDALDYPVSVTMIFFVPGKRAFDLSNKAESVNDLLVKCGVLSDDNRFIVKELILQWSAVPDKTTEGVQIVIQG